MGTYVRYVYFLEEISEEGKGRDKKGIIFRRSILRIVRRGLPLNPGAIKFLLDK